MGKGSGMKSADFTRSPARSVCLPLCLILSLAAQGVGAGRPADKAEKAFSVRIAVEEVRLDAVVLDGKGRQIPNLTADDFEIYQDGLSQKIVSCTYITEQTAPGGRPAAASKPPGAAPPFPVPALPREAVRRVIAFVVDDLSMGGSPGIVYIYRARMAMQKFVETQMLPGDLVAILRTSRGVSALQLFTSDKRELLEKIRTVTWGGIPYAAEGDFIHNIFDAQLSTMSYCLRALRDMPGRKALIFVTAQTTIPRPKPLEDGVDFYAMYIERYNRMADEALRSGVVVHALDITGLAAEPPEYVDPSAERRIVVAFDLRREQALNPLPAKTGGLFIQETNFFLNGIGDVNDALQGYYLLSYVPPPATFKPSREDVYHRTRIKVKRRGATVHTRDGFYGSTHTAGAPAAGAPSEGANPLQDAIFSPFLFSDLKVNVASGYIEDPGKGYMLRSWLHLDARDLNMVRKQGEGFILSLETVCLTSDIHGAVRDLNITKFDFRVRDENLAWIVEHGIRFSLSLPVKRPGSYYFRVAVKDQVSGKIGSAYEYVEIPDLKKGRLALSNLFVVNEEDDVSWIKEGMTKESYSLSPVLRREEAKSPADKSYRPGENIEYMTVIYNAKTDKESKPDLESRFVLYRNGVELSRSAPEAVDLSGPIDPTRIPVRTRLQLENGLQEGEYVLQFQVKDNRAKKKESLAAQSLSFEILPN